MEKKDKDVIEEILSLANNSSSDLRGKKLSSLDLQDKNFTGSDFTGASLMMSNLKGCDFSNCNLTDVNFILANLPFVNFEGAHRGGFQIIKFASVVSGEKSGYAFLCKGKDKTVVLINEGNKKEEKFSQGNASTISRMLYQLLISD